MRPPPTPRNSPPGGWVLPSVEHMARLLPQYELTELVGCGGMGVVYKGRQAALNREVAVKVLPTELAADACSAARFALEARTLASLQHPGIVALYESGQTAEGHCYFVMEWVDGTDLYELIHGPGLNACQTLGLIAQICAALHCAHQQGMVHRDIKPSNILVTPDGRAKLVDFGLACLADAGVPALTQPQQVPGTAGYMAPEQARGRTDHRSDLYALGVMLYEMLTGETPRGTWVAPSRRTPVDARVDAVVAKALSTEPAQRYQQADEMRLDVEHILNVPLSRHRMRCQFCWVLGMLVLLGAGSFLWPRQAPAVAASSPAYMDTLGRAYLPLRENPGVLMCVREIRVRDFAAFAKGTGRVPVANPLTRDPPGSPHACDDPAAATSTVEDSNAFCRWLTKRERAAGHLLPGQEIRLPTDRERTEALGMRVEGEEGGGSSTRSVRGGFRCVVDLKTPERQTNAGR